MPKRIFASVMLLIGPGQVVASDESEIIGRRARSVVREESTLYRVCGHGTIEGIELRYGSTGVAMSIRLQYMNLLENRDWDFMYDSRLAGRPKTKQEARITISGETSQDDIKYFNDHYAALSTAFILNAPVRLTVDGMSFVSCFESARNFRVRVCGLASGACFK